MQKSAGHRVRRLPRLNLPAGSRRSTFEDRRASTSLMRPRAMTNMTTPGAGNAISMSSMRTGICSAVWYPLACSTLVGITLALTLRRLQQYAVGRELRDAPSTPSIWPPVVILARCRTRMANSIAMPGLWGQFGNGPWRDANSRISLPRSPTWERGGSRLLGWDRTKQQSQSRFFPPGLRFRSVALLRRHWHGQLTGRP
jgi:hypothetical protein